jgi:hypothetical protein
MGPSGGGKTFSALRLATGIQRVVGGDIYMIDTEARRGLHYADRFKFKHVPFDAPFGSLDYLEALKFCAGQGGKTIIVDSMSHEHEGPGGLLDLQDQELRRLAGDDYGTWKADRFNMLAWQKPKANRRKLINGLLQINANFIFCFRAKETSKPVKKPMENGREKTVIEPMGFMPIAGDEFVFEMTMNALLLPAANGLPTWQSENRGERMMMKLPEQFRSLMREPRPLDEQMGLDLATWARGGPAADRQGGDGGGADPREGSIQGNGQQLTLAQRADAYEARIAQAPSTLKLNSIQAAATQLFKDLDASDPERKVELENTWRARFDELEALERAAG